MTPQPPHPITSAAPRPTEVNLLGIVEHPAMAHFDPYQVDADGAPYVSVGTTGVVLGVRLGDSVFAHDADHVAPGACLAHPDQEARHALTAFACLGNRAEVRTGGATGAVGTVIGKRGEEGRVIVSLPQDVLARLRPGDRIAVRGSGQGARPASPALDGRVELLNIDPALLARLPLDLTGDTVTGSVRGTVPSRLAGNGLGRPAPLWDLDIQLTEERAGRLGLARLSLGDLVALADMDVRTTMGYRADRLTVGIVVHGASPLPGHGPGVTPIMTGPADAFALTRDPVGHTGLTEAVLELVCRPG
ncbi:DUF4438 domain-containing protein [Streptomyces sp. DT171]|uniref:DUF4438 family protein n=1 Tax=Streptomyces sp. DT171 TaxID=3416524 RepID=UPI003CF98E76